MTHLYASLIILNFPVSNNRSNIPEVSLVNSDILMVKTSSYVNSATLSPSQHLISPPTSTNDCNVNVNVPSPSSWGGYINPNLMLSPTHSGNVFSTNNQPQVRCSQPTSMELCQIPTPSSTTTSSMFTNTCITMLHSSHSQSHASIRHRNPIVISQNRGSNPMNTISLNSHHSYYSQISLPNQTSGFMRMEIQPRKSVNQNFTGSKEFSTSFKKSLDNYYESSTN